LTSASTVYILPSIPAAARRRRAAHDAERAEYAESVRTWTLPFTRGASWSFSAFFAFSASDAGAVDGVGVADLGQCMPGMARGHHLGGGGRP